MRVNVLTNFNGCGLQRDAELLRPVLEQAGHEVYCQQFNDARSAVRGDANIFMEVIVPARIALAPLNYVFVNPEWFPQMWAQFLRRFNGVFCKTPDAFRIFESLSKPGKCAMLGFFARDLQDTSIRKHREFIHVCGKSKTKNTDAVIECWKSFRPPYKLTIVSDWYSGTIDGISFQKRITDAHLKQMMNQAWFHLMPSQYEGYGHSLHEALGCGAAIITTGAPPMSEIDGVAPELLISPSVSKPVAFHYGLLHFVEPGLVLNAVHRAATLSDERLMEIGVGARAAFEAERPAFVERFAKEIPREVAAALTT